MAKIDLEINVVGENCPVPLIEARKALKKLQIGQVMQITGSHPASRKEIPMAMKNMQQTILEIKDNSDGNWIITVKKEK